MCSIEMLTASSCPQEPTWYQSGQIFHFHAKLLSYTFATPGMDLDEERRGSKEPPEERYMEHDGSTDSLILEIDLHWKGQKRYAAQGIPGTCIPTPSHGEHEATRNLFWRNGKVRSRHS